MKKILVTGSKGQLGAELEQVSTKHNQFEWIFTDRSQFDLSKLDEISLILDKINPQIIINCAAYTAVDKAESETQLSDILNHRAVKEIAKWSADNKAKLVHISTDYVFDGNSSIALTEEAETNPINTYGKTKLDGEKICLEENPDAVVIRTSWVYSFFGSNFVKTMLKLMKERDSLNVVNDQIGSPTHATDLAKAIITILEYPNWKSGIYHFSNEGEVSWYEFALAIQHIAKIQCDIKGIPSSEYPTPAQRPKYSLLDKAKIRSNYGVEVPNYLDSLKSCIKTVEEKTEQIVK